MLFVPFKNCSWEILCLLSPQLLEEIYAPACNPYSLRQTVQSEVWFMNESFFWTSSSNKTEPSETVHGLRSTDLQDTQSKLTFVCLTDSHSKLKYWHIWTYDAVFCNHSALQLFQQSLNWWKTIETVICVNQARGEIKSFMVSQHLCKKVSWWRQGYSLYMLYICKMSTFHIIYWLL